MPIDYLKIAEKYGGKIMNSFSLIERAKKFGGKIKEKKSDSILQKDIEKTSIENVIETQPLPILPFEESPYYNGDPNVKFLLSKYPKKGDAESFGINKKNHDQQIDLIKRISEETNYPIDWLWPQIARESGFDKNKISKDDAMGIAQITKEDFDSHKLKKNKQAESIKEYFDIDNYDFMEVVSNPELSLRYLIARNKAFLDRNWKGDINKIEKALINYNPNDSTYIKEIKEFKRIYFNE